VPIERLERCSKERIRRNAEGEMRELMEVIEPKDIQDGLDVNAYK